MSEESTISRCVSCGCFQTEHWPCLSDYLEDELCQDCWEKQCDEMWWEIVIQFDKAQSLMDADRQRTTVHKNKGRN